MEYLKSCSVYSYNIKSSYLFYSRVCTNCLDNFWQPFADDNIKCCPQDGVNVKGHIPYNLASREISGLLCFCKHKDKGCAWSGVLIEIENHLCRCKYNVSLPFQSTVDCAYEASGIGPGDFTSQDIKVWRRNNIVHEG